MALKFAEAIEGKGYHWYLDNIVNNGYGKWPLVVGSSEFDKEKFDHSTVAGMSILSSTRSQDFFYKLIVLSMLFVRKMSFFSRSKYKTIWTIHSHWGQCRTR